jgi:regulatory protein
MKKEYLFEELIYKAASYCSTCEHCISEVEAKLIAWGAVDSIREKVIDKLIAENFIDEKRYCLFYVKDKFRLNKWGKIKISFSLKSKGLGRSLIADALEIIDENEYEAMLFELLNSKLGSLKYESEYEKHGKLFRFAQGRGFENNLIERVIRRIDKNMEFDFNESC